MAAQTLVNGLSSWARIPGTSSNFEGKARKDDWGNEDVQIELATNKIETNSDNIKVAVRVRPPNQREVEGIGGGICIEVSGTNAEDGIVTVSNSKDFKFDLAFPTKSTAVDVFTSIGVGVVQCAYHGYNASLFAYGQTASGKSYSMMGIAGTPNVGLIPRIARLLFKVINADKEMASHVEATYMEIYNETIRDLLIDGNKQPPKYKIRETKQLGIHVAGLTSEYVESVEDVMAVIEYGTNRRTTAATLYNSESSRSHAIFELKISSKYNDPVTGTDMRSTSRIVLVDLAGSERSEKVHSKGIALVEANNINKSLTVLGRCIRALYDASKGKHSKAPFRDSILTWYIRDSLAGNARTTMLATCSPVESNIEETLSTLRYAASAKNIKTTAKKNEDLAQAKIQQLSSEVKRLKDKLKEAEMYRHGAASSLEDSDVVSISSSISSSSSSLASNLNRRDSVKDMSLEEKKILLDELTKQMGTQLHLSSVDARNITNSPAIRSRKTILPRTKKPVTKYPELSCLSKDEILNHVLKMPIGSTRPYKIGKEITTVEPGSASLNRNHFEINNLGIKKHHCAFVAMDESNVIRFDDNNKPPKRNSFHDLKEISNKDENVNRDAVALKMLSKDAEVYVNGGRLNYGKSVQLNHLDRIILGPCRLVALFLTRPLTEDERALWQYEFSLEEYIRSGHTVLPTSPKASVETNVRQVFVDKVRLMQGKQLAQANAIASEMGSPFRFICEMVVRGREGLDKPVLSIDEFLESNEPRLLVACVVDMNQKAIASASDMKEAMSSSRTSFYLRFLASMKSTAITSPTNNTIKNKKKPLEEEEDYFESMNTKQESFENFKYLFEIPLHEFEDVLAELKFIHQSYSKLCNGLNECGDISSSSNKSLIKSTILHDIFNRLDVNNEGQILTSQLEESLLIFDHEKDHTAFLDHFTIEKEFTHETMMNFNTFETFFVKFLQHEFNKCIERFIFDKKTFQQFGGHIHTSLSSSRSMDDVEFAKLATIDPQNSVEVETQRLKKLYEQKRKDLKKDMVIKLAQMKVKMELDMATLKQQAIKS